jgi:hypothetical protein
VCDGEFSAIDVDQQFFDGCRAKRSACPVVSFPTRVAALGFIVSIIKECDGSDCDRFADVARKSFSASFDPVSS